MSKVNWTLLVIVLATFGLIAVTVMNNQVMLALLMILAAFVVVVIYLWMMSREKTYPKPYEIWQKQIREECYSPANELGWLILRGDRKTQERLWGKIKGWTRIRLREDADAKARLKQKQDKDPAYKEKVPDEWKILYVLEVDKRGTSFLAGIKNFILSLPFLSGFKKTELFAVTPKQLAGNHLTIGDIVLEGATAVTSVGCFKMLEVSDLEKDYVESIIHSEVNRITLEVYYDRLPEVIDDGLRSLDANFTKSKELLRGVEQERNEWGIKPNE